MTVTRAWKIPLYSTHPTWHAASVHLGPAGTRPGGRCPCGWFANCIHQVLSRVVERKKRKVEKREGRKERMEGEKEGERERKVGGRGKKEGKGEEGREREKERKKAKGGRKGDKEGSERVAGEGNC